MGQQGTLIDERTPEINKRVKIRMVPCVPIKTILLALNQTSVDYFSLDVEGFELDILKTVPWKEVDVRTLSVEYAHGFTGKESYIKYMETVGYTVARDINYRISGLFAEDFIFTKNTKKLRPGI